MEIYSRSSDLSEQNIGMYLDILLIKVPELDASDMKRILSGSECDYIYL